MKKIEEMGFKILARFLLLASLAGLAIFHLAMESQERWRQFKWRWDTK